MHGPRFDENSDPLAGTAYKTRSFLGEGAMGIVVEAEHIALGSVVVAKLLRADLAEQPDFVDRMRIEAQAMSRLRSPHLTHCSDFAVTPEGRPFLVLERLYGRTVAEEIAARGALPVEQAIDIARQTLAGLAVVHRAGLVHRDIKPSNLFLCEVQGARPLVKILDFGIAKVVAPSSDGAAPRPLRFPTAEGTAVGSPRCLSPEQARGLPVDARTDVYAVGILLYTLLTGKGPFHDLRGVLEVMRAHVCVAPRPPSTCARQPISPELDAIILRALAKLPEERFASADEMSAALARVATPVNSNHGARFDTQPLSAGVDDAAPTIFRPPPSAPVTPHRFDTEPLPPSPPRVSAPLRTEVVPSSRGPSGLAYTPDRRARARHRALGVLPFVAACVIALVTATALAARMWGL